MAIRTKPVGTTNVRVTDVSFGCASIGNLYRAITDAQAQEVLQTAWSAGIRYFDTAPRYGRGRSEMRLGAFLKGRARDSYVISTKVGRYLTPGEPVSEGEGFADPLPNDVHHDYSGDGIETALDGSRSRLGINYIDIVYVHDIGTYTHGADNEAHMEAFLGSGYERLVRLKERGKIGAIGLGVNENEICLEIMKHGPLDVILLAGRLTLLDRTAEAALVPACGDAGTSLVLGGVFNSGILATGPVEGATYDYGPAPQEVLDQVRDLQTRAVTLGMPLASAALHFAKAHPLTASVLIGTAKPDTLTRNLEALSGAVPKKFAETFKF